MEYEKLWFPLLVLVAGWYIVHYLSHERWWKEFRLKKLEEVYVLATTHYNSRNRCATELARLVESVGKSPEALSGQYDEVKRIMTESDKEVQPSQAVYLLNALYCTSLSKPWQDFIQLQTIFFNKLTLLLVGSIDEPTTNVTRHDIDRFLVYYVDEFSSSFTKAYQRLSEASIKEGTRIKGEFSWPFNLVQESAISES